MKTFKVEFVSDTGDTHDNCMCIIRSDDRADVIQKFLKWISPQIGSDESIIASPIKVKEIKEDKIVVYTDFHSHYKKGNKTAI